MNALFTAIAITFAILQIVLFFKLWKMTENVLIMKQELQQLVKIQILSSDNQMKIKLLKSELFSFMDNYSPNTNINEDIVSSVNRVVNYYIPQINDIIEKYNCGELYSVDDFKTDLSNKFIKGI